MIRQVCEFVRGGGLGKVKSVFTIWNKTHVPTLGESYVPLEPALPAETPPEGLDWNLWVGPARYRPYNPAYHRNPMPGVVPWSFCEAFGAGAVTGYHSHAADVIQYAIGMETERAGGDHPSRQRQFPTLTCRYANGVLLHHVDHWDQVKDLYHAVPADARLAGLFGGLFVGERGWITSMTGAGPVEAGPAGLLEEMKLRTREVAIGSNNHHSNWIDCIRSRRQPSRARGNRPPLGVARASGDDLVHARPVAEVGSGAGGVCRRRSRQPAALAGDARAVADLILTPFMVRDGLTPSPARRRRRA